MNEVQNADLKFKLKEWWKSIRLWPSFIRPILWVIPSLILLWVIVRHRGTVRGGFEMLHANLPLTLPVLSVVMAILLDPRPLTTLKGWFKLTNPIALGLVSFAIWYIVASQGVTDYIRISDDRVLRPDYAVLLVITSFIWAGFCSAIGAIAEHKEDSQSGLKWKGLRCVVFSLSCVLLFLPWALFQDKAEVEKQIGASLDLRTWSVSIPYRDPALNLYLGRSTTPLTQIQFYPDIRAKTATEAREAAVDRFKKSDSYWQFIPASSHAGPEQPRRPVEVMDTWLVAQADN